MFKYSVFDFSLQPVPTSPTSTSPTPGGTLGMSKMDAPSMQDVYILSPVSGLYSTRSDTHAHTSFNHHDYGDCYDPVDDTDDSGDAKSPLALGRSSV